MALLEIRKLSVGKPAPATEGLENPTHLPPSTSAYHVIDHRGIIRHNWIGNPGAAAIDNALEPLLKAAEEGN